MPSRSLFVSIVASVAIITGCASVPMAPPDADAKARSFQTDPSMANIYIYRNETFGGANTMPILIDGLPVGVTGPKTYIFKQVDPGFHAITSKTETDSLATIDAKAGMNYFLWQEVKMGALMARSQLHIVDDATGRAGVSECKLVR